MQTLHSSTPSPTRLVSAFALTGLVIWTLLGLGAWAAVGFGGDVLQAVIEKVFWSDPDMGRLVGGVGRIIAGLGTGLVVFVWTIGAGIIWAGWALLRRLATANVVMTQMHYEGGEPFSREAPPHWQRPPMKDITPPSDDSPPPPPRALPPR
jgi:hypothetical protein